MALTIDTARNPRETFPFRDSKSPLLEYWRIFLDYPGHFGDALCTRCCGLFSKSISEKIVRLSRWLRDPIILRLKFLFSWIFLLKT